MNQADKQVPEAVQALINRILFLKRGSDILEEITEFDYESLVLQIKFLYGTAQWKQSIIDFLYNEIDPWLFYLFDKVDNIVDNIKRKRNLDIHNSENVNLQRKVD